MCGIAGIIGPNARQLRGTVERMVAALRHRGPDGSGMVEYDHAVLGHTRLSIIDLEQGRQPMQSAVSPAAITFNGEIYGYQDIRAGLSEYPFRTSSDTEVVLALYERHGERLLSHLPGMFAFGLWDDRKRQLLAARDRFGEKPFYYASAPGGELVFASEIKAVLASGLIRPLLDRESLAHYLQYLHVDPTRTIYRNVHCLPPAHELIWHDGRVSVRRYWALPEPAGKIDAGEAVEEFRRLLDQAVRRTLIADVPAGAFLSGGMDSSTIVAAASRHCARVKTCSFGFEDGHSELPFAREVAGRYATDHVEVDDIAVDVADLIVRMQQVYDEPFGDSSSIPTYLISELARREVKVVLSGDGGDELLGGYSWWYRPLLETPGGPEDRTSAGSPLARRHQRQRRYMGDRELSRLGLSDAGGIERKTESYTSGTLDDALRMDLSDYMPGDILVKTDRASMAHGLELRAPFLDVDFASFCISLPVRMKVTADEDKWILRRAFEEAWPPSVRARGKQGFGAPVREWLGRESVRALKQAYLEPRTRRVFDLLPFETVRDLAARDDYKTWALLVLAVWLEEHPCELP